MNFRNKLVFVAGGTTGINFGIAESFIVAAGAEVDAAVAALKADGGWSFGGSSAMTRAVVA